MIQRNNKYVSTNSDQIKRIKKGKRLLITLGGALVTLTLLSGSNKVKAASNVDDGISSNEKIEILFKSADKVDLSSFNSEIKKITIAGTDITDVSELSNYKNLKSVSVRDNLLTDVSALESLPELYILDIVNNSVNNLNIENFDRLMSIHIDGNYNLYTDELVNYCEANNIKIDITREDVKNVNELRKVINSLDLEGKSTLDKETIIYKYVIDHMEYDYDALRNENLKDNYNNSPLEYGIKGKGVCVTYAALFDCMCELAGINCYGVDGVGNGQAHVWNLVEIDDQYMLCDTTWADEALPISLNAIQNNTGIFAKLFQLKHQEGSLYIDSLDEFNETQVKNNKALESSNNEDLVYSKENKTAGIINKASKIFENIDMSKIDINSFITKLLYGIAAGSVILLSKSSNLLLKNQIKMLKFFQKNNVLQEEQSFEEILSELSDDEKIYVIDNKCEEIFRLAEKNKDNKELYLKIMEEYNKLKEISEHIKKHVETTKDTDGHVLN